MKPIYYTMFFLASVLISCKSEIKKSPSIISETEENIIEVIVSPVSGNSSLPRLISSGDKLFMSWVEKTDTLVTLKYAFFKDNTWNEPEEIISGTDWFVNWADYPAIAENNGNILTSLLQKSASGTYTYDVKLNLFSKEKGSWKNNFILNLDDTQSEHGFVSMLPYKDDSFFVTWLDGRNTVNVDRKKNQMTLRGAVVTSEGAIIQDTQLDERVCDCCQTSATMTPNGPVVVYRNRSQDEIRDIDIVRWENGSWTAPITIVADNWYLPGCPVNGPAIDAFGENLAVAWYTAADDNSRVIISFSEDSGKTFGLPFRLDHGDALGRVDLAMLDSESAVVSWLEPSGEDTLIQLIKIQSNGTKTEPITISKTSAERSSGFPQLEILGDRIYIAWTSLEDDNPAIKVVSVLKESL
ncbi:MAG: hypothetical protein IIB06_08945 [Bacteroidetes bacterium]|nr:hypothetical protein [Bacteroidota bacterium]